MMPYNFSQTFGNGAAQNIQWILNEVGGVPKTYVEVGVFEGFTTTWVGDVVGAVNRDMQMFCIDPHTGSVDLADVNFNSVQQNFVNNISACSHKRIEYINKPSHQGLIDLYNRGVSAQLIYIDGDHRASTVLTDLTLAWQILPVGGIILCDDANDWSFTDRNGTTAAQMSPRMAVDCFIMCNWHKLRVMSLPYSPQIAFYKLSE